MNQITISIALTLIALTTTLSVASAQDTTPSPGTNPPATSTAPPASGSDTAPPPPQPAPQTETVNTFSIGPEVGVYIPNSGRTRSAFGSTWYDYGIGLKPIDATSLGGRIGLDLNLISTSGSGKEAFLIPVNAIYKRALVNSASRTLPYIGASVGLLFATLRSDNYDVHSGFREGFGAAPLIGIAFRGAAYVEARYDYFTEIKGFDLSGLNIQTGFRF